MQEPSPNLTGYRFGVFELDLREGEIRKNGLKIKLQEQPFQVLTFLLQQSPNLVTREDLRKQLWGEDTFVEFDHGLSNAIGRIREALGDSADNSRFIETLPKRGYRFIAPVEALGASRVLPGSPIGGNGSHFDPRPDELKSLPSTGDPSKVSVLVRRVWLKIFIYASAFAALTLLLGARLPRIAAPKPVKYAQVTNFNDEAFSPALSPDGRMIAFIRGSDTSFPTLGEIYIKMLPDGEPVQLTHDSLPKYGVAFTPDGSQITYTLSEMDHGWNVAAISPFGGEPRRLLTNAAGLTWLDEHHVLFSEIKTGLHMGLVTSTDSRSEQRDIYLPEHERGMVHYSSASPDRKWALIVEMGPNGAWQRCRLVPLDGSSAGSQVGPAGACTSAAWSPDGRWMYFGASVNGASHLWRQAFSDGDPEQITSGPAEEAGVAVSRDGRSIISSVGMIDSGVWLHDSSGDHLISSQGYATFPLFSRDGRLVYYLLRRESPESPRELWVTEIASGKSEPVVQGYSISSYDVSANGKEVVFATQPPNRPSQIWLASRDRLFAPRMLASSGEDEPYFGPEGEVIFRASEGKANYLFRMKEGGSGRRKVMPGPITNFGGMSPDGQWALVTVPVDEPLTAAVVAVPILRDASVIRICPAACTAKWSSDGTRFYVEEMLQSDRNGSTVVLPVPKGRSLPDLPAQGIRSQKDSAVLPGSTVVYMAQFNPGRTGLNIAIGPAIDTFAYARTIAHRNLFQIPLP